MGPRKMLGLVAFFCRAASHEKSAPQTLLEAPCFRELTSSSQRMGGIVTRRIVQVAGNFYARRLCARVCVARSVIHLTR